MPQDLFANCPNVTRFSGVFADCEKLTSIPSELFSNCPNVEYFYKTFYNCTALTSIPSNLFDKCTKVQGYNLCFQGCTSITGNVPELWKLGTNNSQNDYKGNPNGRACFGGCYSVSNYSNIPDYWKEISGS